MTYPGQRGEEENRIEEYGMFIPILQSDWSIRKTRNDFYAVFDQIVIIFHSRRRMSRILAGHSEYLYIAIGMAIHPFQLLI